MQVEAAFQKYSEAMVRSMTSFCRDEQAARDAAQHAFLKAVMNRPLLEAMPEPAARAWLYAAARNAVIDGKRRQARLVYHLDENLEYRQGDPLDRITVDLLVGRLPPGLRQPVLLKYYGGMNATEIGRAMDLPASTVRSRLRAAMGQMRQLMKGE